MYSISVTETRKRVMSTGRPKGSVVHSTDPKIPTAIKLERSLRDLARCIGGGHIARGIRLALLHYREETKCEPADGQSAQTTTRTLTHGYERGKRNASDND